MCDNVCFLLGFVVLWLPAVINKCMWLLKKDITIYDLNKPTSLDVRPSGFTAAGKTRLSSCRLRESQTRLQLSPGATFLNGCYKSSHTNTNQQPISSRRLAAQLEPLHQFEAVRPTSPSRANRKAPLLFHERADAPVIQSLAAWAQTKRDDWADSVVSGLKTQNHANVTRKASCSETVNAN